MDKNATTVEKVENYCKELEEHFDKTTPPVVNQRDILMSLRRIEELLKNIILQNQN